MEFKGENSALFLKYLMEQKIACRQSVSERGRTFAYQARIDDIDAKMRVVFTEDDTEIRITISDFFYFEPEHTVKVLKILNDAPEREYLVASVIRGQVRLHKDITVGGGFSPKTVFDVQGQMCLRLKSLMQRLQLINAVLS